MLLGLAPTVDDISALHPGLPKLVLVAASADYHGRNGTPVLATDCHLLARLFSLGHVQDGLTGNVALALAVAAAIPGTLVNELMDRSALLGGGLVELLLGYPDGVMDMGAQVELRAGRWQLQAAVMGRTARRLMEGSVCIPLI